MEYNLANSTRPKPSTTYYHVVTNSLSLSLIIKSYFLLALTREPKKTRLLHPFFQLEIKTSKRIKN